MTATPLPEPRRRPSLAALDALFAPRRVAVVGASEAAGSAGRTVLWNLLSSPFGGIVFPIAPRPSVLGVAAYPTLAALPAPVDLAIIATPLAEALEAVRACAESGVRAAVLGGFGFRQSGAPGAALEREIVAEARRGGVRLLGANSFGLMRPPLGLNASFAREPALPGHVAFFSQSVALGAATLDWARGEHIGFSAFVSVGAMFDIGWGELLDYFDDDPHTRSIVIYMEAIGDARSFLSAAREAALSKPIVVLKSGRGYEVAHNGSPDAQDDVVDAALRRCGVLRVDRIEDMFGMAAVLARQPRPRGPRLTILTNAGGPGVLAADALALEQGSLAPLSPETLAGLDGVLPPQPGRHNPIDLLGDADAERYAGALRIALQEPSSDGLLVILAPQPQNDPAATARAVVEAARATRQPVLASWLGGEAVAAGEDLLNQAGIPTFAYPDAAVRAFLAMWRAAENVRSLYETPALPPGDDPARRSAARIIAVALADGRSRLSQDEARGVLEAYGIATAFPCAASSEREASVCAKALGYPVALRLPDGTARGDLCSAAEVRRAFRSLRIAAGDAFAGVTVVPMLGRNADELTLGSETDAQFGPVLRVALAGRAGRLFPAPIASLPPLNVTLARRMLERTRLYALLDDPAPLESLLVRFSQLIAEQPRIRSINITRVRLDGPSVAALDAEVALHGADVADDALPRPAIRPYPAQYVAPWTLRDGGKVLIRPIRPEDEPLLVAFHESLSEETVYMRYFFAMSLDQRVSHERLTRICFNDYDREMALVAERQGEERRVLAVGRLTRLLREGGAEFAVIVSDEAQGQGLGSELLRRLIEIARAEGYEQVIGDILPDNYSMQRVCKRLGFKLRRTPEGPLRAELQL